MELDISDLDIKIRKKDEIDDSVILASKKNGTLCIGITNDLVRRVYEHKHNLIEGFTKKYNMDSCFRRNDNRDR